ncbi:probable nitrite reductase NiiA [Cephalotrichum gorgonifer]|uniref:Nitrite reductase [NAD(P)H] n=1 Tax=Cephalotrichum gorgonifer TaxID=2041049 RepID=A0AAE8SVH7_9PEZI|nr:probable nitrite reductase NiiA [Cephalotrichum gorgonifer]
MASLSNGSSNGLSNGREQNGHAEGGHAENDHTENDPTENGHAEDGHHRKRVVVVGLGMVGVSFIEKLLKLDAKRREYNVVVIGEEPHLAYNRVGLTSFFEHHVVENLYMNPKEWYASFEDNSLSYHLNTRVTEIHPDAKYVSTSTGDDVPYDILVLATGSDAVLPRFIPGHDANGVFVYRTIADLQKLIKFAGEHRDSVGITVGGGLLGLEAAKAMRDLECYSSVKIIEMGDYLMARQLDVDAGQLVGEGVRALGLDVMCSTRIAAINVNDVNNVTSVTLGDGERIECSSVCFAIGVRARDDLARSAAIKTGERTGGFAIDEHLQTSVPGIYAIGDCASWNNQTFGIIGPGVEMASVLSFNLTDGRFQELRTFDRPDMSTKLKLLGMDVASFGDFFADRDGPKIEGPPTPPGANDELEHPVTIKALTYKDPFGSVYKKYLFTQDGKFLVGGMMIGDTRDYAKLTLNVRNQTPLDVPPSQFILGAQKDGEEDGTDLPDEAQVCSCNNVTKGDIVAPIKAGTCTTLDELKKCTKAGTGCGGCVPLVQSILRSTLKEMGQDLSNNLCKHFAHSRADLYNIVAVKRLQTFEEVMWDVGETPDSLGCEVCKPTVGSILASLFNEPIVSKPHHDLQDTNDRFLANIQRNGTFSVVPRVAGGEITPKQLMAMATVADKYGLYCKITGGQRIDMFGAKKQDLLVIWKDLVDAGLESGHAYAKALRTVKSCVGSSWCRYGVGDSVGMAIRVEERYKSIRAPHKLKGGVSGCIRECAEAQSKDFGLIATEKGYNIFVGGNGGAKPRHAELLAKDIPPEEVIPLLDRYLIFYIRTADRLQRTARWIEGLPGGINYLKAVVIDDKLGICADMEKQMEELVSSYFCEWTEILKDPERQKAFRQFGNTDEGVETVETVSEREQKRPAYWPKESPANQDFKNHIWSSLTWQPMIEASHFNSFSSANVKRGDTQLAIFKVKGKYYATQQMCPHKRAFVLSDGLVGEANGQYWVSCPYHKRNFDLNGEQPGRCSSDESMNIATFPVEEREDGWVYLELPPVEELDVLLGTSRWKTRKEEASDPFERLDQKLSKCYKGRRGRKPEEVMRKAITTTSISW